MPTDTNLNVRLISAHHTEAEWNSITTIPKDGELLFTDTGLHDGWYKRGDGIHQWKDLLYIKPSYDYSEINPIKSKTFYDVICSTNSDPAAYLYFATIKPDSYLKSWRVTYRLKATINGISNGYQYSDVTIDGARNTYIAYKIYNAINNTSYRPLYNHLYHAASETGINNNYPHLLGIRFQSSYNPHIAANSRIIKIDIIEEENCTVSFLDSMTLFADMSGANTTNYGNATSGVNATRSQFDGTTQGYTVTGDRNDTVTLTNSYTQFVAGTHGLKAYSLCMQDGNGTWQSFTTNAGYNVTKTKNPEGFRLGQMYYVAAGSNYAAGEHVGTSGIRSYHSLLDLRYSTNCQTSLTARKPLYIKGTYNPATGLFYLADTWWTQTEPTTEDGFVYLYIGWTYDSYRVDFSGYHPPIWYKNGTIRPFVVNEANSTVAGLMSAEDKEKLDTFTVGTATMPGKTNQSTGWFRIAKIGGLDNGYANFTMFVTGTWWSGAPTTGEFKLHVRGTGARITQTGALLGAIITQIRLVYDSSDNKFFVDVYQGNTYTSTSTMGTQLFKFFGHGSLETYNPTEPLTGDDITAEAAASLTIKDNGMVAPKFYGALEGNANTATTATNLDTSIASSAGDRPIWMSWINSNNKRATYDNDFTYDSSTNTLKVKKIASPELTGTPTAPTAADGNNTTQIATTAFVQNAVGNTEIGGRNLVKDSHKAVSNGSYATADYYFGDDPPLDGEEVTIQIKGKLADTKSYWNLYNSGGSMNCFAVEKERYDATTGIYTDTGTWRVGTAGNTFMRIYAFTSSQSGTSTIEWVKLERGNKPTDWTPAPEDLVSDITLSGSTLSYKNPIGTQLGSYTLTKSTIGLGNVDNTSDANKPISTATQTALDQITNSIGNAKLFTGTCSTAAGTTEKDVTCTAFKAADLVKGAQISVYFDNTNSADVASLKLNVNSTGAKPIKHIYNGSYANIPGAGYLKAGQIYTFTYDGTNWVVEMMYNTDADWKVRSDYGRYTAGTVGLFPYTLVMQTTDGRWESIVTSSSSSTNKAKNTHGFLLGSIFYRSVSTTVQSGGIDTSWQFSSNTIADARYSFNIENTTNKNLTPGNSVYLVGTIGTDGLFYLADTWWTQSLPTTEDSKYYIYLGAVYDWYRFNLDIFHPIYKYVDNAVRQVSLDSITVNGHTVDANVPSTAVFTDTKVTQTLSSSNANYPLLFGKNTTSTTTNYTDTVLRNNSIYANPNTGIITAPYYTATKAMRVRNQNFSVANTYTSGYEFTLYTGIKFVNGGAMPVVHITGYMYALAEPIDLLISFYMYSGKIYSQGVVDRGGWHPQVYIFKYQQNDIDYIAITLTDTNERSFTSLNADVLDVQGNNNNIDYTAFRWAATSGDADSVIPEPDNGATCIEVPYRTNYNPKPTLTIQGGGTNIGTYNGTATATINVTKSSIGLGNVENKSSAAIRGELTASNVTTALGYTPLNKAGDSMSGTLTLLGNQYGDNYSSYALNLNNSNIIGVNSIYTSDLSDNSQEGIHFYRSTTAVDTLYAKNGVLYFVPNRTIGQTGTSYTILNSNNYTSYVPKLNDGNTAYLFNKGAYVGSSGAKKYLRITLPDNQAHVWNMFYMEVSLRQHSPSESGGKILIEAIHNATSPYTWTGFNASVLGYLPSTLTVHASDAKYFYILNDTTYASASLDRVLVGDTARSYDISAITLDWVDELPETHQDATMYYGIHTGNISAHLNDIYVNRSGDTMTGGLVINPPTGSYNEGVRINQAPSGWSAVVLGGDANSTTGVTDSVWGLYTYNKNMYLSHAGSSNGTPRLVGTADGWELQGNRTYINGILQATHIANGNGQGNVILCDSPLVTTNNTLVNDPNTKLTSSTNIDEWIKALLKQICVTYPGRSDTIFRGWIGPSSRAYYEIYIYNTSVVDSTTGLPQYSFGRFNQLDNTTLYIYTHQYEFTHNTMIHTANYSAWFVPKSGGTFSGNVTINGNLTIGSGKNIILPNNYGIAGTLANGSTTNTWMLYMGSDDKVRLSYNNREVISLGKITSSNGFEGDLIGHASLDLPLTGGTMTGPLKWNDGNALPQATSASYLLTIDSFTNGGTTKWITTDNVKVGSATKDGNGNVIATSYVNYGGNDTGLGSGTPAANAKTYFTDATKIPNGMIKFYYNNSGTEFTTVFSKAPTGNYGSILKWGYCDRYLRILRRQGAAWKSEDWEKVDAGFADSAGYTTKLRFLDVDANNDSIDDLLMGSDITFNRIQHLNIGWASNDGLILNIPWSTAYGRQIALDDDTNWMATRAKNNTSGWTEWDRIVTKSYGDTLYLSKTGTHDHTVMDLSFGTKGLAGSLDPITAYNIGPSASNKTFGLPAEAITVEYSTDAGATWQDYGLSDYAKKALFAETREQWIYAGKNSTSGQGSTNYWLRVTIYPSDGRYAYVNGLYLWVSRAGVTATVDLQRSTRGNPDTFTEVFSGQDIAGWSGNNIRYFSSNSFGGSASQTANGYKYRMIFKITSITDANYGTLSLCDIRFLGSSVFSYPSGNYMMKHNRLYNWDADLNAVFPANIIATKFIAPIIQTGTDSTSYFQSQKFRGQGNANTYYHAIDFGYDGHNQVDFYEYGGIYNFWKNTGSGTSTAALLGKITTNGWEGNVVGNVTGHATTATTANEAQALITLGDKRNEATTPDDYKSKIVFAGLKAKATVDNPSSDTYSYVIGLRGWADKSGGNAYEFALNNSGINYRLEDTNTTWGGWNAIAHAPNGGVGDAGTPIYMDTDGTLKSISVKNLTSATNLGWVSQANDKTILLNSNALAYWNGRYNDSTSNLAYCNKGAFGSIVTKNTGDYIPISGSTSVTGTIQTTGNLRTRGTAETQIGVGYKTEDTERWFYLWGNNSNGTRGIWDDKKGCVIQTTDTSSHFYGTSDSTSALLSASTGVSASTIDDFISVNQLTWAHASSISGIGLSGNDGMVIAMPYSVNSTSYGRQFLIDDDSTKIFTRYRSSNSWKDWDQVLTRSVFDTLGYLPMYSTAIIGEDLDYFMTKNGFQWAKLTNATGLGLSNNDGMVFYVPFGNSFNSGRQFILDDDSNKMFTRYKASGSSWTSSWDQILTKSVADGIYASGDFVSKSGDTITGGYLHISNGLTNGTTYDDGHINFNGTGTNAALIQFRDDVLYLGASRIRITDYSNMALEDPTTVSLTGDLTATGHITGSFGYAMLTIQNKAISTTSHSAITGFTSSHYNDTLFSHSGNTITVKKHGVYRMVIRWHLSSTASAASVKNIAWAKSGTTTEFGWGAASRANTYETITSEFLQEISANTTLTLIGRSEGGSSTFRGINAWVELLELL